MPLSASDTNISPAAPDGPTTCNLPTGADVPIPNRPDSSSLIASLPPSKNLILLAVAKIKSAVVDVESIVKSPDVSFNFDAVIVPATSSSVAGLVVPIPTFAPLGCKTNGLKATFCSTACMVA